uniref:Metallothionein-like protein n=1 Tax=Fagus sylvatica TaxID=28930 RepID=A0A2N9ESF1_FAGSY
MSSCGSGSCNCGSSCKCGSGCNCNTSPDLSLSEMTSTETIITGVAPVKNHYEGSEMSSGAENGCKCGSNCTCDPCNCK